MLVATEFSDDAAIVRPDSSTDRALVLTADVIAPIVDDPETFGEIAAVNSISDVYAMGGRPLFALNLAFFPDDKLPLEVLGAILRGGARACQRLGVIVVGGHTVRDPEIKFGLSVTGEVMIGGILSNRTAREGQALVLTKALGTGVLGTAIKKQLASPAEYEACVASMTRANDEALAIARRFGVTSCTDVTGFGLLGHLRNILRGSSLAATVSLQALPLLPGALEHAAAGRIPGGSKANLAFIEPSLTLAEVPDGLANLRLQLAADAQTSGGLLLCLPADEAAAAVAALQEAGMPAAKVGALEHPSAELPAGHTRVTA